MVTTEIFGPRQPTSKWVKNLKIHDLGLYLADHLARSLTRICLDLAIIVSSDWVERLLVFCRYRRRRPAASGLEFGPNQRFVLRLPRCRRGQFWVIGDATPTLALSADYFCSTYITWIRSRHESAAFSPTKNFATNIHISWVKYNKAFFIRSHLLLWFFLS